jgi:signal transduction histidine kinase
LVAAQPTDEGRLLSLYVLAALGAVLLGGGAGAASSAWLTRWAVGPLQSLSSALRRSRPEKPGALDLDPVEDCDEVEAIRAALVDLTAQVQRLVDQAERFAADAAHELRTPLTVLRAEVELMAEQASNDEQATLARVGAQLSRLSELVERLLLLASPSNNLRLGFETVSVAEVVEDVSAEFGREARARLQLQLDSEGLVRGDPLLLRSLVSNALQNALKFARSGPVSIAVKELLTNEFSEVSIEIRDSGPGIPTELHVRVLEPFFRIEPAVASGHGLGLALIGHIARAHGGRAEFQDVSVGACLSIVLPAWRPSGRVEPQRAP